ncbi:MULTISPECIES: hypothetical protein [Corynebacterium]|uniref:Putative membrane protein n=1 Tax=Corynebacterium aurimucosum (strain ATCC 700975 / DSM 44827 / CIP 107346 / CN-1) TaxID=548476 RepID=C3PKD1_CORA7|nr:MULTISPECIES: hypothetical protein [Corynebacterium]ACP34032.1 putative membrane protein [Corynebacterium aurimucosum ATCC 700975]MBU5655303.1 hypothetical protein [Corynebacterium aurimucosum]OFP23099.1 hypothetical protein HMPREF2996_00750 [Corynebacterium sp. HMSC066C02]OFP63648.1 hypothetical protein HMPREF2978_09445 [Corynebacterium sp. HMSC074C01]OFT67012.1 hypothetical protein HMPREF3147_03865 [Corynebacterium sp. HMSC05D03]
MTMTILGIISITLGFICVLSAYYLFQRSQDRTWPIVLGLLALLFLTVIPAGSAIFVAATH